MNLINKFLLICKENNNDKIINYYQKNINIDLSFNNEEALKIFCNNKNFLLVKWILSIKQDINIFIDNDLCFQLVCLNGSFEIFSWLYINYCNINSLKNKFKLITNSFYGGNIKLVKFIYAIFECNLQSMINKMLPYAFRCGNSSNIEFLFSLPNKIENSVFIKCIEIAYIKGDITNLNLTFEKFPVSFNNLLINNIDLHYIISLSPSVKVFEWIMSKAIIIENLDKICLKMIEYENLEVVKYIINKYPNILEKVNCRNNLDMFLNLIFSDFFLNVEVFIFLFENFDIVKELIELEINNFFILCCDLNNLEIVNYLMRIFPDKFKVTTVNKKISHWCIINYLEILNTRKIEQINDCPICLENKSDLITNCEHQFCYTCLNKIYCRHKKNVNCPLCRAKLNGFSKIV